MKYFRIWQNQSWFGSSQAFLFINEEHRFNPDWECDDEDMIAEAQRIIDDSGVGIFNESESLWSFAPTAEAVNQVKQAFILNGWTEGIAP